MAKASIRINTVLTFDADTEADLVKAIQGYAKEKKLNRFLESVIREVSRDSKTGVKGTILDRERENFFKEQREAQGERELALQELAVNMAEYQMKLDKVTEKVQDELVKLYILANSGKLLGLKEKAKMLNTENLLISVAGKKYQSEIWQKYGRPDFSSEEEQQSSEKLERLSGEVMEFLSERYTENLSELRSLFVTEAEPQSNQQLIDAMMQIMTTMQTQPVAQGQQAGEQAQQAQEVRQEPVQAPVQTQQPVAQTQQQVIQIAEPEANKGQEPTQEDFSQVMNMFGSCFDFD